MKTFSWIDDALRYILAWGHDGLGVQAHIILFLNYGTDI